MDWNAFKLLLFKTLNMQDYILTTTLSMHIAFHWQSTCPEYYIAEYNLHSRNSESAARVATFLVL